MDQDQHEDFYENEQSKYGGTTGNGGTAGMEDLEENKLEIDETEENINNNNNNTSNFKIQIGLEKQIEPYYKFSSPMFQ